ncbi:hypothetical protein KRR26_06085 [Corallococcus sp. M34]|uniref:hypothetical protein n=1 Tax=Citreicoccus inhibens TaxID=2849499 RepID=UPI0011C343AC|nr:hypothetical protein [Citreicoccus inhibens]MBU8895164.1 hypothetical protein [Citreicoccus inhibens]
MGNVVILIPQSYVGKTLSPQLDVSYFFNEQLSLGGYFQYGASLKGNCPPGSTCAHSLMRFGVDLNYQFAPVARLRPWVGVGAGYEILNRKEDEAATDTRLTYRLRGFELGHANVGLDFQLSPSMSVGPYVTAAMAQYSKVSSTYGSRSTQSFFQMDTLSIPKDMQKLHAWLQPGLRLQFRG